MELNGYVCTQCGDYTLYINRPIVGSGLQCKDCHNFNRRCNYYANRERDIARQTEWNKANADKLKGYVKKYQEKNREKINAYSREYCRKKKA